MEPSVPVISTNGSLPAAVSALFNKSRTRLGNSREENVASGRIVNTIPFPNLFDRIAAVPSSYLAITTASRGLHDESLVRVKIDGIGEPATGAIRV